MHKKVITYSLVIAVALFSLFGFLLNRERFNDPEVVFRAMLEDNLRSYGVTKTVEESGGGQELEQRVRAQFGSQNIVNGVTYLSEGEGNSKTSIVTENIGTLETDYIRYTDIDTQQKSLSGEPLDFSNIIGIWGASNENNPSMSGGDMFGDAALAAVPTGNLEKPQRDKLLKIIEENKVYDIDYSKVEKKIVNGRPQYVFAATVVPEKYVGMLKEYAKMLGLDLLASTDPAMFRNSRSLNITFTVDVWSRQLLETAFLDTERSESYGAYGQYAKVIPPKESITIQELQTRLQAVR